MTAKTISKEDFNRVVESLHYTSTTPIRDTALLLLSFKAGLRVGEIAQLRWDDVQDAFGNLRSDAFEVRDAIAKNKHGRVVPMHPALMAVLALWRDQMNQSGPVRRNDPIIPSVYGRKKCSPDTLQKYMTRMYERAGLYGVTSHSGRRTFITYAARMANAFDCSIKDVQRLAGHRQIETTERYIDASETVGDLVRAI